MAYIELVEFKEMTSAIQEKALLNFCIKASGKQNYKIHKQEIGQ
ncbi:hypothetical protein [Sulfurimonas sp.]